MTGTFFKRFVAYFLDFLLVSVIVTLLSYVPILNPNRNIYNEKYNELFNVSEQVKNNEISEEEYNEAAIPISYDLYRLSTPTVIISIVCYLLYFGVLPFFCNGQTIGKRLFQIKVVSNNDKELKLVNYLLRALILGNILISVLSTIVVFVFDVNNFYLIYQNLNFVGYIINYISLFMILVRQDNRGIHDFVAGTKVVFTNEEIANRLNKIEKEQEILESELENNKKEKKEKAIKTKVRIVKSKKTTKKETNSKK